MCVCVCVQHLQAGVQIHYLGPEKKLRLQGQPVLQA